jgi:hypothetical protein
MYSAVAAPDAPFPMQLQMGEGGASRMREWDCGDG